MKRLVIISLVILVFLGCGGPHNSGNQVRIPVDDGTGHYGLKTVSLKYVTDINKMKDSAVTIKYGGVFSVSDEGNVDINQGQDPNAHFIESSGVLIPSDNDTLIMTTLLYHFEQLKDYYQGLDGTIPISFPWTVSAQAKTVFSYGDSIGDNAAFFPILNFFAFWYYSGDDTVPIALNSGVPAHEYFHSVFSAVGPKIRTSRTIPGYKQPLEVWRSSSIRPTGQGGEFFTSLCSSANEVPTLDESTTKVANSFIIDSLNEGTADYFAYEYTKNPGWILPTTPKEYTRDLRSNNRLGCTEMQTRSWLAKMIKDYPQSRKTFGLPDIHMYGAFWSRFLFQVSETRKAQGDSTSTPLQVIKFVRALNDQFDSYFGNKILTLEDLAKLFISQEDDSQSAFKKRLSAHSHVSACLAAKTVFPNSEALGSRFCQEAQ